LGVTSSANVARPATIHSRGFRELAAELTGINVDLIVARGTPAILAARNATATIPSAGIEPEQNKAREVPQRPRVRFDLLPLAGPSMHSLNLACPPAYPEQLRGFAAGQPSQARLSFGRRRHAHEAAVQRVTFQDIRFAIEGS
jgi:hypothetical protein